MQAMTLEQHFERVTPELVGVWRFRVKGQKPKWCCTYTINGMYYDTMGADTIQEALTRVWRVVAQNRKNASKSA